MAQHSDSDVLADWDFDLPAGHIARHPAAQRAQSRLMVLPRDGAAIQHRRFADLGQLLVPGDLLVANDTRVMAARLGARRATGGRVELLLLEPGPGTVHALARPARKLARGEVLTLDGGGTATVVDPAVEGVVRVALDRDPRAVMEEQGRPPLPPYLERDAEPADRERYQTVYAGPLGAAAAPTAGLHFTEALLAALAERGVGFATLTLHVGLGTFRPLRPEDLARGALHEERYAIDEQTAAAVADCRARGGRVIAVGTTAVRALESATPPGARAPLPGHGTTRLLIQPPYAFSSVDALITNFHLPRSSLLLLVGALVGRSRLLDAYTRAVAHGYRFYSYGDAMLIV